jgi:hypothetical protein
LRVRAGSLRAVSGRERDAKERHGDHHHPVPHGLSGKHCLLLIS